MTWADFYLICFAVGFAFSLLMFVAGGLHWHLPHLPHLHLGGPRIHVGHGPLAGTGHGSGPYAGGGKAFGRGAHISPFNLVTLSAFLAWFGGTGYLLSRYSSFWFVIGLGIALLSGLAGAGIVFFFLSRVLMSEEENLDPADFEMAGVLGRTSVPIREGGTGEIIYSQAGTRRTCGARAENGNSIAKGSEVVVTRYEKGIAYVRLWTEMADEDVAENRVS
jgi:membrane protein implicated in regulation of membrane protease activity